MGLCSFQDENGWEKYFGQTGVVESQIFTFIWFGKGSALFVCLYLYIYLFKKCGSLCILFTEVVEDGGTGQLDCRWCGRLRLHWQLVLSLAEKQVPVGARGNRWDVVSIQ